MVRGGTAPWPSRSDGTEYTLTTLLTTNIFGDTGITIIVVVVGYPTPCGGWGRGGTPWRPSIRAMPHGRDQSLKKG